MRRLLILLAVPLGAACASQTVLSGHAALKFDPESGLDHEVLQPGTYPLHGGQKLEDYDVRMEKREENVRANTSDGRFFDAKVLVVCRPIVSELYGLASEEGHDYYETLVKPELRHATREVFAHETGDTVSAHTTTLDHAVLAALRQRLAGKHLEITDVMIESVTDAKITM
jgi:hypothetical protein